MLNRLYLILGSFIPLSYAAAALLGFEPFTEPREHLDPNTPGGIRHSHHWVAGYRGGK
jgi:hypothetical protein